MKISGSNAMYLCDCWVEANKFVTRSYRDEGNEIRALGDILVEANYCHPRANILIWRFLESNASYYLTDTGEPIALAKKWLSIPMNNLEASGNHLFILSNGVLGQGDREQIYSNDADTQNLLGGAKGRPIVVNPADWNRFIFSQAPDPHIDLQTAKGRADYIGNLYDTKVIIKKAEAIARLMELDVKKTPAVDAWRDARNNGRPEMGDPGRKTGTKN